MIVKTLRDFVIYLLVFFQLILSIINFNIFLFVFLLVEKGEREKGRDSRYYLGDI